MHLRVDKPPQEGSPAMVRAANIQVPLPPPSTTTTTISESGIPNEEEPFHFLSKLSSKSKLETSSVLEEGLAAWRGAMTTIEDALRAEFERRCFIRRIPAADLERTDTEPLEEEYDGELIGFPVFLSSAARDEERGLGASSAWADYFQQQESSARGRGRTRGSVEEERGRTPSRHKRSLSRCSTVVDVPFPAVTDDDPMEGSTDRGPRPSDEMLLREF